MGADLARCLPDVERVVALAERAGSRPVMVTSAPGGGADLVVLAAAELLTTRGHPTIAVAEVDALDASAQLELRGRRRTHALLLGTDRRDALSAHTARLIEYLRPSVVDVEPLGIDGTRLLVDAELGDGRCSDELAATIQFATAGRAGDVCDAARHLSETSASLDAPFDLRGFQPTRGRLSRTMAATADDAADAADAAALLAWAVATAELVPAVAGLPPVAATLRPVDAIALRDGLEAGRRVDVLRRLCAAADELAAGTLAPDEQVTVASWWCELADASGGRAPLLGPELQALFAGVLAAVDLNRWSAAGRISERLWRTTHVAQAATGVAAALARATPTPLLDELLAAHPDDEQLTATSAFARALWHLYVEHRPDEARETLEAARTRVPQLADVCDDGLATIDLHTGDPEAVERRVGDRPPQPGQPTSFALGAMSLADLVRGKHQKVLDRMDAEVERQLHPGMNLTADRYRFVHSLVLARSGLGEADERAELATELRRLYEGALRRADDWNLGWTAWAAGQLDARAGRSRSARRRLGTAVRAFHRAHRPGFADWPLATLLASTALHVGDVPTEQEVTALTAPQHAVTAERTDALLALSLHARASGRPQREVAALLREAMAVAHRQREVVTGHLVAVEQLLLGIVPDAPPDDGQADGPVLTACRRALLGAPDDLEGAGELLVEVGWNVLGVRLLAHAAESVRRDDPRRATRLLQTVRATCDGFDEPLRPWVLTAAELPTLSARELEIARGVASGASRDELAATLVLSRRTIDSHLQRVYAKLGISSRAQLREWLDG